MSTRPFSIVCAVDLSEISASVVEHALSEAYRHRQVGLHFMTVIETRKGRFAHDEPSESDLQEAGDKLRALVSESLPAFADARKDLHRSLLFHMRVGKADEEIVELAMEARADRIVVGRHRRHRHRGMLGGISAAVVNTAPCTVEIVQVVDYGQTEEDYDQCSLCVQVREQSGGNRWFCSEHSVGRSPRLTRSVGITTPTPGWGIF